MSLPAFTEYINPLLAALRKLGGAARPKQVFQAIARDLAASSDLLEERLGSGASRFENQIAWARWYLVATGFIDGSQRGVWKLTDKAWTAGVLSEESLRQIVSETQSKGKAPPAENEAEVPESSAEELDIEKLKTLYESDNVSQWFLEHVASRQRNQSDTSVERALQILRSDGHDVSRQQIISVFKGLADCNCGQFLSGTRMAIAICLGRGDDQRRTRCDRRARGGRTVPGRSDGTRGRTPLADAPFPPSAGRDARGRPSRRLDAEGGCRGSHGSWETLPFDGDA